MKFPTDAPVRSRPGPLPPSPLTIEEFPTMRKTYFAVISGWAAMAGPAGAAGPVTIHGEPTLDEIERHYLAELLERHQGNRRRVAEALGVSERTAYRMLERHGFKGRGEGGEG